MSSMYHSNPVLNYFLLGESLILVSLLLKPCSKPCSWVIPKWWWYSNTPVSTSLRYTTIIPWFRYGVSAIWDFGTVPVAQRIGSCSTQSRVTALKYGRPSLKISGKQQQPPLSSKRCSSKSQPSSLCFWQRMKLCAWSITTTVLDCIINT